MKFTPKSYAPLKGVVVIDLSRLVSGNMLSLQLADMGAEIIKVESLKQGDPLRSWKLNNIEVFWKIYSRNKKSIALDYRSPEFKKIIYKMVKKADVFIENFRPGVLKKIGISIPELQKINRKLIIVQISGFGKTGNYKNEPAFGTIVEAMSGFASRNGYSDKPPLLPPLALADMMAGLQGAYAVLVALREVEVKNKNGQIIDLSLFEPIFSTLGPEAYSYKILGEVKKRQGNRSNTAAPRDIYITKDSKYIALSSSTQNMTIKLFNLMGTKNLINNKKFNSNENRIKNRDEVNDIVANWFKKYDEKTILKKFKSAGITASPIYSIKDIYNDENLKSRNVIVQLPDDDTHFSYHHNIHPRLSTTPGKFRYKAPKLGEHSEEILHSFGFDKNTIKEFKNNNII